jgi:peptidyl-prolyl cis-trans isomerase C
MFCEPTKRRPRTFASLILTAGMVFGGAALLASQATAQTDAVPAEPAPAEAVPAEPAPAEAAQTEAAPAGDAVVATIDGHEITESDLRVAEESFGDELANVPQGRVREALVDTLIDLHLVTEAAEAAGLDNDQTFKQRMDLLRQRVLQAGYFTQQIAPTVTDEMVQARYDELIADTELPDEVRASHILVGTKEEAEDVLTELDQGGDFAELAKERSKDPGSAPQGGDLDYFAQNEMIQQFADAAFALEVGETSAEPVQSSAGWHVIKVVDRRKQQPPSLEQVEGQLRNSMIREAVLAEVNRLREAADIAIVGAAEEPVEGEATEEPADGETTEEPAGGETAEEPAEDAN